MVAKIYYDLSRLSEMLDGDKDAIINMIKVFNNSTPDLLAQISDLLDQGDLMGVAKVAHNLKSSVSVFGVYDIMDDIDRVVLLGRQNSGQEEISILVSNIDEILTETMHQLEAYQKDLEMR